MSRAGIKHAMLALSDVSYVKVLPTFHLAEQLQQPEKVVACDDFEENVNYYPLLSLT